MRCTTDVFKRGSFNLTSVNILFFIGILMWLNSAFGQQNTIVNPSEFFPLNLGDTWQYVDSVADGSSSPFGYSSPDTFEIKITRIDSLHDGTKYIYFNNSSFPKWRIDSSFVYLCPSLQRIYRFDFDTTSRWWFDPDSAMEWRRFTQPFPAQVLDREVSELNVEQWISYYADDTNWVPFLTETYAEGLGLAKLSGALGSWNLTGCIINGDTVGKIIKVDAGDELSFFPLHVGDKRQYYENFGYGARYSPVLTIDKIDTTSDGNLLFTGNGVTCEVDTVNGIMVNPPNPAFAFGDTLRLMTTPLEPYWMLHGDRGGLWRMLLRTYTGYSWGRRVKYRVFIVAQGPYAGSMPREMIDVGGSEYYAEGFGNVYTEEQFEGWFLSGAVINGDSIGTILGVKEKDNTPKLFSLSQNYPNPFNPSTTISYQLTAVSRATLKIYDILGREVKTLVEERETAGQHVVYWDGTDRYGRCVASGVYYYRLTTPIGSITKKAVLVK